MAYHQPPHSSLGTRKKCFWWSKYYCCLLRCCCGDTMSSGRRTYQHTTSYKPLLILLRRMRSNTKLLASLMSATVAFVSDVHTHYAVSALQRLGTWNRSEGGLGLGERLRRNSSRRRKVSLSSNTIRKSSNLFSRVIGRSSCLSPPLGP
jgi:hypothetical protein